MSLLNGFANLKTIESGFFIYYNQQLTTIDAFDNLTHLGQALNIIRNPVLRSIEGFNQLKDISGELEIRENDVLKSINGFNGIKTIGTLLRIAFNEKLLDIQGFNQLLVTQHIVISELPNLIQIDAFKQLERMGGTLVISDNQIEVLSEESFGALVQVNSIYIGRNIGLTTIQGFNQLKEIDYITIEENDQTQNIIGFNSLTRMNDLTIKLNPTLVHIEGFSQLYAVNNDLTIHANDLLHHLEGFEALRDIGNRVDITNNPALSNCCALACWRLAEMLPSEAIFLNNNANNCNRLIDIQSNCTNSCPPVNNEPPEPLSPPSRNIVSRADVDCQSTWIADLWGNCIGQYNNLIPYDYLKDGTTELITYGKTRAGVDEISYWYIAQFDENNNTYKTIYRSKPFGLIHKLLVVDIAGDGSDELIVISNDQIQVISLTTLNQIANLTFPSDSWSWITVDVKYGDVDQDGEGELLVMNKNRLLILDDDLKSKAEFEVKPAYFDIGNVDADPAIEIVFVNGEAYELRDGELVLEYDLGTKTVSETANIVLEDTDGDGYEEAIVPDVDNKIHIYDVELEHEKLAMQSSGAIFTLFDVNNDGQKDLIHGTNEDNLGIVCSDIQTGELIWNIDANRPLNALAVEDFDGDGVLELAAGLGCYDRDSDQLRMFNINNQQREWRSEEDGTHGPVYDIEIADLDQDGQKEIISFQYYNFDTKKGAIRVYDALTKELEYVSEEGENLILSAPFLTFSDNYMMEVGDYGNDGDMDIFVTTNLSGGSIWVIDGDDFSVEVEKQFELGYDNSTFYDLMKVDLDQDGNLELVALTNNYWYVFSLEDLELKQRSRYMEYGFVFPSLENMNIEVGNINANADQEVVVCKYYIYHFDANAQLIKQSLTENYAGAVLMDWDKSGDDMEIIAVRMDGELHVLDENLEILEVFILPKRPNQPDQYIQAINITDFNNDGEEDLLITARGQLYMMNRKGHLISSQNLGREVGKFDAIHIEDYDEDGTNNILVGFDHGILDIDPSCIDCLWFDAEIVTKNATCGLENGVIKGLNLAENAYLQWGANTFTDSLSNLNAGAYEVYATNEEGCRLKFDVQLEQENLLTNVYHTTNPCFGDSLATALLEIKGGVGPFSYNWSNGATDYFQVALEGGGYTVSISDQNNCMTTQAVDIIDPEPLVINWEITENEAGTTPAWVLQLLVEGGTPSYDYLWHSGWEGHRIGDTGDDIYTVTVTDFHECQATLSIDIEGYFTSVPLLDDYTLKTYPNPAIDQLHLAYNGSNPINAIHLVNIQGQEQAIFPIDQVEYVQNNLITLQLPQVRAGIYFLLLQIGADWYAKKIVVGE